MQIALFFLCILCISAHTGLPPELYTIWEAYPWRFGQPYCVFKTFLTELMSSASVLTILAFTVERYVAICHPLRAQAVSTPERAVKTLIALWVGAFLSALPYSMHTRTYHYLDDPRHSDGTDLRHTRRVTLTADHWQTRWSATFHDHGCLR